MDEELYLFIKKFGLFTEKQINNLIIYITELIKFNKKHNLISRRLIVENFFKQCILPTIMALSFFKNSNSVLDIGSGAGLPGIILAIFFPLISILLVEKKNKKANFLYYIKDRLYLKNVSIKNINIESLSSTCKFDIITSQAVTNIDDMIKISEKHLDCSGKILIFKGKKKKILDEIHEIKKNRNDREINIINLNDFYEKYNGIKIENIPLETNLVLVKTKL